jgi:DNA repair exonuclease SbcCD ATPase subunit
VLDVDLLIAFVLMILLFLRQISIIKKPNKINYAPLMIGIGAISSVVHFILHPEATNTLLILKESFFPLLVSLLLYIVMNIIHQTQQAFQARTQQEFTKALIEQITKLKEFTSELERKMILNQNEDRLAQEEVREKFKQDIKALSVIQNNQTRFLEKFEEMDRWHNDVTKAFENFVNVQLPALDDVVNKHIEILRVAEQDHFNKVKSMLEKAIDSRCDIADDMEDMKATLEGMKGISESISKEITSKAIEQLSTVTKPFEQQILSLKSHTESLNTTLYEDESKLGSIREQSEMIMKQMLLSSKKMSVLESQSANLHDVYADIKELIADIEVVKSDYVKSQSQLESIVKELDEIKSAEIINVKDELQKLNEELAVRIDNSLEKLHKHYHMANEGISKSVQFLAKQAQIKNSYTTDLD